MEGLQIKIINKNTLNTILKDWPVNATTALLFGGDRLWCIDWAVVAILDGVHIGLATVAEQGEEQSGIPTLVGLAVRGDYRRMGVGTQLVEAVIGEAERRELCPLLVEPVTVSGERFIRSIDVPEGALTIRDVGAAFLGIDLP